MGSEIFPLPRDANPQLKRAAIFISTGDFQSADAYCEKVLDAEPECALAYLLKVMAKCRVKNMKELIGISGLPELTEFKLARQFADSELAAELDGLLRDCELRPIRMGCAARLQIMQTLSQQELPENLAAAVQERIQTEQALMAAPDYAAAVREATATVTLQNHISQRSRLLQLLHQMKEGAENGTLSKRSRQMLSERIAAAEAILDVPVSETPVLVKEIRSCEYALGELKADRDTKIAYCLLLFIVIAVISGVFFTWLF